MIELAVNLEALAEVVDRMASFERAVASQVDDLDARARLVSGAWSGSAAGDYAAAHQQWATGARELHEALRRIRRLAATAHVNYTAAVSANRTMWSLH